MGDSLAEMGIRAFRESTALARIAQNAGLAHGVAWVAAATAGPDGWDAICCPQLAGVARWTWSHNSGKPTGNIWPLSSSVATTLTSESFMRAPEYTTWCQRWRDPNSGRCCATRSSKCLDRPPAGLREDLAKAESGVSIPRPLARRFNGAGMDPVSNPKPERSRGRCAS